LIPIPASAAEFANPSRPPYATVLVDVVPAEEEANVREAMDACPEQAISIEE
jgi:hypothetical protein